MLTSTHSASTSSGWLGRLQTSRWAALPVLMAGTFMIVLDFFIVNVALPSMQSRLHAGPSMVEWVVAGYGLTFSTFLIAAGRLGDRIGRRRTLSIGLALFAVASAGCGLAPTASALIGFRLLQGLGAALVGPTVLSIIGVTYSGPDRVRAISVYGTVMGVAAAGGQLIGGALVQANPAGLGWRSVFLINLPIAAAALALSGRLVPESRAAGAARLDLVGTALVIVGLTAIVLPLVQGRQYGWPTWTIASLAAAPLVLGAFVWHQISLRRRGGAPLVDMSLFKDRAFSGGLVPQLVLWCGQASFFLVLALYLQQGRGLSALSAGLVFTILAAAYLAASIPAPALTGRFGRSLVGFGALTLAAGHGLLLAAVWHEGTGGSLLPLVPGTGARRRGHGAVHHPAGHRSDVERQPGAGGGGVRDHVHGPAGRKLAWRGGHRCDLLRCCAPWSRPRIRTDPHRARPAPPGRRGAQPLVAGPGWWRGRGGDIPGPRHPGPRHPARRQPRAAGLAMATPFRPSKPWWGQALPGPAFPIGARSS